MPRQLRVCQMISGRFLTEDQYYEYFFFFNDTATTEIYTLSLHDALPISAVGARFPADGASWQVPLPASMKVLPATGMGSEEHTSELQSRLHLVCRLLLEKKKNQPLTTERTRVAVLKHVTV